MKLWIVAASTVLSLALYGYGTHLSIAQAKVLVEQNHRIIFAACRAYHRRDVAAANAASDAVKVDEQYLMKHPKDQKTEIELPILQKADKAAQDILHFNCLSGMAVAEQDAISIIKTGNETVTITTVTKTP